MYCVKCGAALNENANFCSVCGQKVELANQNDKLSVVDESAVDNTERESNTLQVSDNRFAAFTHKAKLFFTQAKLSAFCEIWRGLSVLEKLLVVGIAICTVLCLVAYFSKKIMLLFVGIIQIVLLINAWQICRGTRAKKKKNQHIVLIIFAVILMLPHFSAYLPFGAEHNTDGNYDNSSVTPNGNSSQKPNGGTTDSKVELKWPNNQLASLIPVPDSIYGETEHSSENELKIRIDFVSAEDFDSYVSECVNKGFSNIKKESTSEFEATNYDGYRLVLSHTSSNSMYITVKQPLYTVELTLDGLYNLFFNRYDVTVYVDGKEITSIAHGGDTTVTLELEKGKHTLKVTKYDDYEPKGTATLDVTGDTIVTYQITSGENAITLKRTEYIELRALSDTEARVPAPAAELRGDHYQEVIQSLTTAGFTNITATALYDIVFGWTDEGEVESVSIAGDTDFATGAIYTKDAEVVITYHMWEEDNPARIKMTKNATDYEGLLYTDVEKTFVDMGFTNVAVEKVETSDRSYEEGEVYRVTIDYEHFESGDSYLPEEEVLIKYYTVSASSNDALNDAQSNDAENVETTNITIDNNLEFSSLMKIADQTDAPTIRTFANSHIGRVIEFDGCIALMMNHADYETRFDVCIVGGDYNSNRVYGPLFAFENVNFSEMNVKGTDTVAEGMEFTIVAEIRGYSADGGYIILKPISLKAR